MNARMKRIAAWLLLLMMQGCIKPAGTPKETVVPDAGTAAATASADGGCGDEACPIPTVNEDNEPVYAIVSPVGYHAVEMIGQGPRLDTLAGKRIALMGGGYITVEIRLPEDWDALIAPMGYEPLRRFEGGE